MTLNPKVQGSTPCASTIHGGFEFQSTPYLGVGDAACHAQWLFDSLSDRLETDAAGQDALPSVKPEFSERDRARGKRIEIPLLGQSLNTKPGLRVGELSSQSLPTKTRVAACCAELSGGGGPYSAYRFWSQRVVKPGRRTRRCGEGRCRLVRKLHTPPRVLAQRIHELLD